MRKARHLAWLLWAPMWGQAPAPSGQLTARELFHGPAEAPRAKPAERAEVSPKAQAILASARPETPLGVRYSIVQEGYGEVDPDAVFRSGDRIRLSIESNDDAYLYIVHRGSSGNWSVLFPTAEIAGGDNLVRGRSRQEIPPGHWFAFDEQAGEEKLFIVLCRRPEQDLEGLIYAVRESRPGAAAPPKTLLAVAAPIGDSLVGRFREQVFTRDLIFEKVTGKTSAEAQEKAVYVVNPTGGADARVIVDVGLQHR